MALSPSFYQSLWQPTTNTTNMQQKKLDVVEMIPAFSWTCNSCGIENFSRAVVAELTDEELEELRKEHHVQPWETGDFMKKPNTVECRECKTRFATVDFNGEE